MDYGNPNYGAGIYPYYNNRTDETYGVQQSTAPTVQPVTVDEVRQWGDVATTLDDQIIRSLIATAVAKVESATERQICTATWKVYLDRFPWISQFRQQREINVPYLPMQSVTSLAYVDSAGASATLVENTDFRVDLYRGRISPAYGKFWPAVRPQTNAVTLTYVAGYGVATDVPDALKTAIKIMVIDNLVNRGGIFKTPPGAQEIIDQYWTGSY